MKEHPIPFTGEMVRAILDGGKTQTRRVIKPQPTHELQADSTEACGHWEWEWKERLLHPSYCPYGAPSDLLWVRETWWKPPHVTSRMTRKGADTWPDVVYDADCDVHKRDAWRYLRWSRKAWIHMPRSASRITLSVTGVRVQRVQEINERDASSEGLSVAQMTTGPMLIPDRPWANAFSRLWDSLNAKRGYGWDVNPWVWVIEFAVKEIVTR